MDPKSEIRVREAINNAGMRVVGWYHSHPSFAPDPSFRDIETQANYQLLFRDHLHHIEPFIGLIIQPFDIQQKRESAISKASALEMHLIACRLLFCGK